MRWLPILVCVLAACSSDGESAAPGKVVLEDVVSSHAPTVIRVTTTIRNASSQNIETLDTIEVDPGTGAKRASGIVSCEGAANAPWLVKAGANASVTFTVRNNGPDRMAVSAECAGGGVKSAVWEFPTFTKVETEAPGALGLSLTGTYADGSIWTVTATSTRE